MNGNFRGHELFVSRMQDAFKRIRRGDQVVMTSFLTLSEQSILQSILPKDIQVFFWGGYDLAERKMACLTQDFFPQYDTAVLVSKFDSRYKELKHPDVLGALMALGLEREQIGDIIVEKDQVYVVCKNTMAYYIMDNALSAGKVRLSFELFDGVLSLSNKRETILVNTSSLRLDSVVAALAKTSRTKAADMIRMKQVKLNDIVLEDNKILCNNDFVSIRRTGRFLFVGVENMTKKNRLILHFEKYI